MTVTITQEHNEARLAGTLAFLDAGANPARLRIYGGTSEIMKELVARSLLGR